MVQTNRTDAVSWRPPYLRHSAGNSDEREDLREENLCFQTFDFNKKRLVFAPAWRWTCRIASKNDNDHGGGFAVRQAVSKTSVYRIVEDVFCQVYYGGRSENRFRGKT